MANCYIVCGVREIEYQRLRDRHESILHEARHDFNQFNAKYWEPKVKSVRMGFAYDPGLRIIYLNVEKGGKLLSLSTEEPWMSEPEKQLAWNLRHQIKKNLKAVRERK